MACKFQSVYYVAFSGKVSIDKENGEDNGDLVEGASWPDFLGHLPTKSLFFSLHGSIAFLTNKHVHPITFLPGQINPFETGPVG